MGIIGEQFDVVRNHIDDMGSLYNRNYDKLESVPTNILPIVLDNLGWNAIIPFSSSLADYFGQSLSSVKTEEDIAHNTTVIPIDNESFIIQQF